MQHNLRILPQKIVVYKDLYDQNADPKLAHIRPLANSQGYLEVPQLHELAKWKSRRRAELVKSNHPEVVREITAFAFSAKFEESRIGALVQLKGISFPTASVILHFCVDASYPILDFRAIWSLGMDKPSSYSAEYWIDYINLCRDVAKQHSVTVRELDMALWKFSEVHQRVA